MGSYGNDVWLSCSWCATPETISYHKDVDGVGILCLNCFVPATTPPTRPTSATMDDRSPPPPTPPLSEETKEKKAKRQRRETSERWNSEYRRQSRLSCATCLTKEGPKNHCRRCGELCCRECVNIDTALCYFCDEPNPQSIDAEGTRKI